jgi:hypothetical protein
MPQSFKRLGAINPTANTQTNVYVIPAATEAVISTVTICNQSSVNASYSLISMTSGEYSAPAPVKTFLVRGATVPASDSIILTLGITMNAGSILAANTNNGSISIIAFGSELT